MAVFMAFATIGREATKILNKRSDRHQEVLISLTYRAFQAHGTPKNAGPVFENRDVRAILLQP